LQRTFEKSNHAGSPMEWLNYHHLLYFWTVAREGSIARACDCLHLSQPTISAQLHSLERSLGMDLFRRVGRNLVLTETGQIVFRYADEIFSLGREMIDTIKSRPTGRPLRLTVGIADVVPKMVAFHLLKPSIEGDQPVRIVCREDKTDRLMAELAVHGLDLVISDSPMPADVKVKAFSHFLGECGILFLGTPELADRYREGFPRSLDGAPFLLPTGNSSLNRELERWFGSNGIRPQILGEFEDSGLMMVFGKAGLGVFPVSAVIGDEVQRQLDVKLIGRIDSIRERYYAISIQRKLRHPAVVAICEAAPRELFKEVPA
jgi:LysR family transcriptional regulator, transcriptional activator of nhaA